MKWHDTFMTGCLEGTGNRNKVLLYMVAFSAILASCTQMSEYESLPHSEAENRTVDVRIIDTLHIDASRTSLSGEWHLRDSVLLFIDNYIVGVKEYSSGGVFKGEHILQGRGPGEMIAPAWSSAVDEEGNLLMQDTNCFLYVFDRQYKEKYMLKSAWFTCLQDGFGDKAWGDLLHHPDPEAPMMYEYHYASRRNLYHDRILYLPVITEHVSFNGYELLSRAGKFWKKSYCFMSFDPHSVAGTKRLFGHYPPIYRKGNIPIFGGYDFTLRRDSILVSFSADPKIYVMDLNGKLQYSFGTADPDIKCRYPRTRTFDEYEEEYDRQRDRYGFYDRLKFCGEYLFRTCKTDSGEWKMQVYRGNVLSGEAFIGEPVDVIGEYGGMYYAAGKEDIRNEKFKVVRFAVEPVR